MNDHTDILSRFPGPVLLASRRKFLRHFFFGLGFTFLAIYMLLDDPRADGHPMILVAVTAFFLFGTVCFAILLLPGAITLQLDARGFEITAFYRKRRVAWKDATDFTTWTYRGTSLVIFNDASMRLTWLVRLNALFCGHNNSLPATYGLPAQALADVMTAWRERALRG
jgi:hypothetical protein